jgi:hypothetical protein
MSALINTATTEATAMQATASPTTEATVAVTAVVQDDGESKKNMQTTVAAVTTDTTVEDVDDGEMLSLVTQEGTVFSVRKKAAMISKFVATMVEENEDDTEIPLPNATAKSMGYVLEFMAMYDAKPLAPIPTPVPSVKFETWLDAEYLAWVKKIAAVSVDTLFGVLFLADYMDVEPLILFLAAYVGNLLQNKDRKGMYKALELPLGSLGKELEESLLGDIKWTPEIIAVWDDSDDEADDDESVVMDITTDPDL